ncbi:MAG: glutamate-cysteine ligase family protein [Deltaproteobacteria bacterium]
MSPTSPLHLFQAFGIELEYMIVSRDSLDVLPVADRILQAAAGKQVNEVERGNLAWSNELALHVLELKTNGPVGGVDGLSTLFATDIGEINSLLASLGGRLLPGAMHPWMDPANQTKLWPHGDRAIYQAYDRIFSCQGHGWSNLQSVHLNIGFCGDEEFGRLHAAIRLLLPILPALSSSSPIMDGRITGTMDNRLQVYRFNQQRVPSVTGRVIPEAVFSRKEYEERIFRQIYREIAPFDPEGILQYEWLNSRGAIARFERSAIEIRLLDVQECPQADLAICASIIGTLKNLVREKFSSYESQKGWKRDELIPIFDHCIAKAEEATITNRHFLGALGWSGGEIKAGRLWQHLVESCTGESAIAAEHRDFLHTILTHGTLARRILRATGEKPDGKKLAAVFGKLCECLEEGRMFTGVISP